MARSVEDILRHQIGSMAIELAIAVAQKEALEERVKELEKQNDSKPE